jgi:hypothetical protein
MTKVVGHTVKGNMALFDEEKHLKRMVDAFGPDVVKVLEDFVNVHHNAGEMDLNWTVTRVEAGAGESTIAVIDGVGGIARITTDANEDDGISAQMIGEAWELTSDQVLYFGAFGCKLSDATQSDMFIGLAITDTAILGGVTDRIGFEKLDGATALKFMLEKDSTETLSSSLYTVVAATAFDVEFYWDGAAIEVFVNGASVATPAVTNLPNDEALRISWEFLAGAAAAKTMEVDKIVCIMIGR